MDDEDYLDDLEGDFDEQEQDAFEGDFRVRSNEALEDLDTHKLAEYLIKESVPEELFACLGKQNEIEGSPAGREALEELERYLNKGPKVSDEDDDDELEMISEDESDSDSDSDDDELVTWQEYMDNLGIEGIKKKWKVKALTKYLQTSSSITGNPTGDDVKKYFQKMAKKKPKAKPKRRRSKKKKPEPKEESDDEDDLMGGLEDRMGGLNLGEGARAAPAGQPDLSVIPPRLKRQYQTYLAAIKELTPLDDKYGQIEDKLNEIADEIDRVTGKPGISNYLGFGKAIKSKMYGLQPTPDTWSKTKYSEPNLRGVVRDYAGPTGVDFRKYGRRSKKRSKRKNTKHLKAHQKNAAIVMNMYYDKKATNPSYTLKKAWADFRKMQEQKEKPQRAKRRSVKRRTRRRSRAAPRKKRSRRKIARKRSPKRSRKPSYALNHTVYDEIGLDL